MTDSCCPFFLKSPSRLVFSGESATVLGFTKYLFYAGEMPEWSIGTVSKTVVQAIVPRVRIPVSPPDYLYFEPLDERRFHEIFSGRFVLFVVQKEFLRYQLH